MGTEVEGKDLSVLGRDGAGWKKKIREDITGDHMSGAETRLGGVPNNTTTT